MLKGTIVRYRDILISPYEESSLLVLDKLVEVSIFECGRISEKSRELPSPPG